MLSVLLNFANENIKTKQNSEQHTAAFHFLIHVLNESGEPLGSLDLNKRLDDLIIKGDLLCKNHFYKLFEVWTQLSGHSEKTTSL